MEQLMMPWSERRCRRTGFLPAGSRSGGYHLRLDMGHETEVLVALQSILSRYYTPSLAKMTTKKTTGYFVN